MAWVNVTNVVVKCQNPAPLSTDFSFEVSFQCLQDLTLPIGWRLVYVGCAGDKSKDQELESVELGPIKKGALKFTFESDPPDFNLIDPDDVWGTTVILLEGTYRNQDFIRIGWYVHNVYIDPALQDDPPDIPIMSKLVRYIAADEPRVTRFSINWSGESEQAPSVPDAALLGQISAAAHQALIDAGLHATANAAQAEPSESSHVTSWIEPQEPVLGNESSKPTEIGHRQIENQKETAMDCNADVISMASSTINCISSELYGSQYCGAHSVVPPHCFASASSNLDVEMC
eukprot:Gregarina_sp_Poly_1__1056@NODE_125_length_13444_cov_91_472378_g111_i0_p7_GENE_NODE_125_length_13444_cov_91_472378_g111_i0NODE_125_length_13444_cov_91_472378_g111_i0_p7_ORF_typecomplete_len288_score27_54ASF1_hist_chap/PF04729_13/1_6e56_NODE_125_length_13444_cov_91_472378_g111_i074198282